MRPLWRRIAVAAAVGVVGLIGFARVTLGVHYLSDVVGGWIFAAGWVAATMAAFRIWRKKTDPQSRQPGALDAAGSQRLVAS